MVWPQRDCTSYKFILSLCSAVRQFEIVSGIVTFLSLENSQNFVEVEFSFGKSRGNLYGLTAERPCVLLQEYSTLTVFELIDRLLFLFGVMYIT